VRLTWLRALQKASAGPRLRTDQGAELFRNVSVEISAKEALVLLALSHCKSLENNELGHVSALTTLASAGDVGVGP